ncbi:MAG: response regulator [Alphaproteobacteria bacterium]|nr:response regulator [Alphaproteobacteria bacterium]
MQTAVLKELPSNSEQEKEDAISSRSLRVLIVDDNEALTKTLGWMIEMFGHEVRAAKDGESGLVMARSFIPDVMLLDIGLPGMSGYELCRGIRKEPGLERSYVIAQTGWDRPEHREMIKNAGFDEHLVKPVAMEKMEEIFQRIQNRTSEA